MTKTLRDWVTALRSGNYIQTKGTLNRDNSYCCLGVFCEVAEFDKIDVTGDDEVFKYIYSSGNGVDYDLEDNLTGLVETWFNNIPKKDGQYQTGKFKFTVENDVFTYKDGYKTYSEVAATEIFPHLNDTTGLDFNEIADIIEAIYDLDTPIPEDFQ
jgi:hypothetical protein